MVERRMLLDAPLAHVRELGHRHRREVERERERLTVEVAARDDLRVARLVVRDQQSRTGASRHRAPLEFECARRVCSHGDQLKTKSIKLKRKRANAGTTTFQPVNQHNT